MPFHILWSSSWLTLLVEKHILGGFFAVKFPRALAVEAFLLLVFNQLKSVCNHLKLGAIVQTVIIQIDAVWRDGFRNIVEQVNVALSLIHRGLFLQFFIFAFALSFSFTFSLSLCLFSSDFQFRRALVDLNCIIRLNCDITWAVVIILLFHRVVVLRANINLWSHFLQLTATIRLIQIIVLFIILIIVIVTLLHHLLLIFILILVLLLVFVLAAAAVD